MSSLNTNFSHMYTFIVIHFLAQSQVSRLAYIMSYALISRQTKAVLTKWHLSNVQEKSMESYLYEPNWRLAYRKSQKHCKVHQHVLKGNNVETEVNKQTLNTRARYQQ